MNCLPYCDIDAPMCPDGSTCTPGKIPGDKPGETKDIHYCKPGASGANGDSMNSTGAEPAMGGSAAGDPMNQPMGGMSSMPDPMPEPPMEPARNHV